VSDIGDRSLRVAVLGVVPDDDPTIIADMMMRIETLEAIVEAVIGAIPEDRNLWRINWLKSLLDGFETGELMIGPKCDDPSAVHDCITECRLMVRDVNNALADWPQADN
jgi:hypothetical protein